MHTLNGPRNKFELYATALQLAGAARLSSLAIFLGRPFFVWNLRQQTARQACWPTVWSLVDQLFVWLCL